MARRLTAEERLERLAAEMNKTKKELAEKRKKDMQALHLLAGKAIVRYFQNDKDTEEDVLAALNSLGTKYLSTTDLKRFSVLLDSKNIDLSPN